MLRKDARVELLGNVPLFAECSKKELRELASIADEIDVREGTTLMKEGSIGREFFVLIDGHVRVTQKGRELADLGPADWVGEIALLTSEPRGATVVATTPLRALVIVDYAFRSLMAKHPSIATKILGSVAVRLTRNAQS
jgi:CRP/FNR family cyclic AMP-dependent transcriptional regulator